MARYSGSIKFTTTVSGIYEVKKKLGARAARLLDAAIEVDMAQGARKMTLQAYKNAPVDTGALRTSILASVKKEGDKEYIFGSALPYAQRQEYEHRTKKQYLHRAVRSETPRLKRDLVNTIKRQLL